MKKLSALLFLLVLLSSCVTPTPSPSATAANEATSILTLSPLAQNTCSPPPEPMMVKVAEFGKGFIFDHALSPDGKTMALGSSSGLYLYDTDSKEIANYFKSDEPEDIQKVTFSPDGSLLAYQGETIRVLDRRSRDIVITTNPIPVLNQVNEIIISGDNQYLAFITDEMSDFGGICAGALEVWDIVRGEQMTVLAPPPDSHYSVDLPCAGWESIEFNQNSAVLYAGFGGGLVAWSAVTWDQLFYTPAYTGGITDLFFDPKTSRIVSVDDEGFVRYWNANHGQMLKAVELPVDGMVSLHLTEDRKELIVTAVGYPAFAVDYETGKLIGEIEVESVDDGYTNLANQLYNDGFFSLNEIEYFAGDYTDRKIAYSGNGKFLAVGCTIVDSENGKLVSILSSCRYSNNWLIAYSAKGQFVAEGASVLKRSKGKYHFVGVLKLWNAETGVLLLEEELKEGVFSLAFSSDEKVLAVGTESISLWNTQDHTLIRNFYLGTGRAEYLGFRDSDQTLVVVTVPGYLVYRFEVQSGVLKSLIQPPLPATTYGYEDVALQNNFLAIRGATWILENDGATLASSQLFSTTDVHVFSPDGKVMIVGKERELVFTDTKTGKALYTFNQGFQDFHPIFSPDGKHIAFIAFGGTIQVWDVSRIFALASP